MPRSKSATPRSKDAEKAEAGWRELQWSDLEGWAGEKAVARGKAYQEEGRVQDLSVAQGGDLLATVEGNEDYATHVWLERAGDRRLPESECTCPVGYACKHAVAAVVEYLKALADKREVPAASEDDPRWYELDAPEDDGYDDEPEARPRKSEKASKEWDEKIRKHLRTMPQEELADLAWTLVKKSARDYEALRERLALQELDPGGLIAEARREIKATTSIQAWRNHWDGAGELPDYRPTQRLLQRLLDLGRADDVVALGRDLIRKGIDQVGKADDDGETIERLHRCLPVVFEAVSRSKLAAPDRLLFAIDAAMADPSDVVGEAADAVFEAPYEAEDWSAVADVLAARRKALPAPTSEDYGARYDRRQLARWLAEALEKAGRRAELPALYEAEARLAGDYEWFIAFLIEEGRLVEAEHWAREGVAAKIASEPGTASHLAKILADLAAKQGRWDVVAAHAARAFFDQPHVDTFQALMKAAAKAGVESTVRAGALRFLKTGVTPYEVVGAKAKPRASRTSARGKAGKPQPEPAVEPSGPRVKVDPAWPLPLPDELVAFLERPWGGTSAAPRWNVLIDLALAEGKPDEALAYYDRMRAGEGRSEYGVGYYADRIAEAVAGSHPERSLAIYKDALDARLPQADAAAYEACANYLDRLRPIYQALGRTPEWTALVASIREKYRNRPRFMERLDGSLGPSKAK
ncbi:SWIM zinc finger family protein [Paludisphaera mucosa]|uniref:SWIM zinc finger family protein n=1 Tax=Paludisphaera mucosa TaxID=3030827 RepID=A0ABT6FJK7_9BACT|nr:SWIM zinc finger family protein [Paludisphaera mucosa]MDG3007763.1 SWIM zinc finger family protein [Paludisphaera mucosa]